MTINLLCQQSGTDPLYPDIDKEDGNAASAGRILPDTFHGMPVGKAVRIYLAMRRESGVGPALVEDIYDALLAGGHDFKKDKTGAIQGLSISLGKSAHTFRRLPNDHYGLTAWYGDGRKRRRKPNSAIAGTSDEAPGAGEPNDDDAGDASEDQ